MDILEDRYADLDPIPAHDMNIESYYCEWRRCWLAFDANLEPDEDGSWCHPLGAGRTRKEAEADLFDQWYYSK